MIYLKINSNKVITNVLYTEPDKNSDIDISTYFPWNKSYPDDLYRCVDSKYIYDVITDSVQINPIFLDGSITNNIWHFQDKIHRFYVPSNASSSISINVPAFAIWIKRRGLSYIIDTDSGETYVYFTLIEDIIVNGVTYPFDIVVNILTTYGCKYETLPN